MRDVVVDRTSANELLAVSQAPGVTDEAMRLDLMGGGVTMAVKVVVKESRPVVIAGAVRHRIRLEVVQPSALVEPPIDASVNAAAAVDAV